MKNLEKEFNKAMLILDYAKLGRDLIKWYQDDDASSNDMLRLFKSFLAEHPDQQAIPREHNENTETES